MSIPFNSLSRFMMAALLMAVSPKAAAYSVRGTVTDASGEQLEFATVRIFSTTDSVKPVALGVGSDTGAFNIQTKSAGSYRAHISAVGSGEAIRDFELTRTLPDADLGTVELNDSANLLGEVVVTATKPVIERKPDRIAYDVAQDPDRNTQSVREILRKVPLVTVDADGTIKLRGSSSFKIYKNGRPNSSYSRNAKELFAAIPASTIKSIEVITDPGAREDAEGATMILNIVTNDASALTGVMGSVEAEYSLQNTPRLSGSLMGQLDKVTLSVNAGVMGISKRSQDFDSATEQIYDNGVRRLSRTHESGDGELSYFALEGSWEPDSLNLVTAEFGGFQFAASSTSTGTFITQQADGTGLCTLQQYATRAHMPTRRYFDINGAINYQRLTHRKDERFTASYQIATTRQQQHSLTLYDTPSVGEPLPYSSIASRFNLRFIEHTFQLDWHRPFGSVHILDAGAKYILRQNHSDNDQEINYNPLAGAGSQYPDPDFRHDTHIAAIYADYMAQVGKWAFRAGLRYEFSRLNARYDIDTGYDAARFSGFHRSLSDLVPSASVMWNINDLHSLKLAFSTRIQRPGINYLYPAAQVSPTAISAGNPDLESAHLYSLALTHSWLGQRMQIYSTASLERTGNMISDFMFTDPATLITYS